MSQASEGKRNASDSESIESPPTPGMIVGVGASAGGFEAFKELLAALPERNGIAFVFIQHMDPGHESLLATLLSRFTRMEVQQVQRTVRAEPDHVYVAPPNANLVIAGGMLNVRPVSEPPGRHKTIDFFLRSLAVDQGAQAIGVVLSGTGSDGVLGLKAIKGEGGITLVQDNESAHFSSMPQAAVAAEVADFVLPPAGIAQELMRIKEEYPRVAAPLRAERSLEQHEDAEAVDKILALVWNATNVDFSYYKPNTLRRRITRRMLLNRLSRPTDYLHHLEENQGEVIALYQDLVINVTSFFRDPDVFEALKRDAFPRIIGAKSPHSTIRIWVPGCSTGEEVYSLAIALTEFLHDKTAPMAIQLFGTDISDSAIERARAGIYPENIEVDVSAERLRLYFAKRDSGYQIAKPIRDLCIFARQNVVRDPPFSNLDLISCRNVLIYFGQELQARVFPLFHYALSATGFLLLGAAESVGSSAEYFDVVDSKHRLFVKKPVAPQRVIDFSQVRHNLYRLQPPRTGAPEVPPAFDPAREADLMLLDQFAPASVLIDADLNILQFRGQTGAYLQPAAGPASLHLLKMAREGLMVALHTAIQEARSVQGQVQKSGVRFRTNGDFAMVNINVLPVTHPQSPHGRFYLVLFESSDAPSARAQAPQAKEPPLLSDDIRVRELQHELDATKDYLQSVIGNHEASNEELRSANEEILSANEELQSTNEELETAKEELQSANEELTTLNDELQTRNVELAKVNDDLNNLLGSVQIGIVMVDHDVRIRRFTPLSARLMNLLPTDVGRPLADINPHIAVPDLSDRIRDVIDSLSPQAISVRDADGIDYKLRIKPYRTEDNRIDGALVMLSNGDAPLAIQGDNIPAASSLLSLVDVVHEPMLVLSNELRMVRANESFFSVFGLEQQSFDSTPLFELADGRFNVPALRRLLEQELPLDGVRTTRQVEVQMPGSTRRRQLQITARRVVDGSAPLVVMAMTPQEQSG
jgi:two-component system, chemotaxis family, CheB/CheR fusion protein